MKDDFLEDPVFLLRVGEDHRLRIALITDARLTMKVKEVLSVEVSIPGCDTNKLRMVQEITSYSRNEIIALLKPPRMNAKRLQAVSPCYGTLQQKYVPLNILITFSIDEGENVLQHDHEVFCRMMPPKSLLAVPRFLRSSKTAWEYLPQRMREGTRASISFAKIAIGV